MIKTLLDKIGDTDEILREAEENGARNLKEEVAKELKEAVRAALIDIYGVAVPDGFKMGGTAASCLLLDSILEDMAKTIIDSKEGE